MKLNKAIEIQQQIWFCMHLDHRPEEEDAVKLGIEALKRPKEVRKSGLPYLRLPLPGETEE